MDGIADAFWGIVIGGGIVASIAHSAYSLYAWAAGGGL